MISVVGCQSILKGLVVKTRTSWKRPNAGFAIHIGAVVISRTRTSTMAGR
jgi:hypothetical protein